MRHYLLRFIYDADLWRSLPVFKFQNHISQIGAPAFILTGIDAKSLLNDGVNGAGAIWCAVDMAVQRCNEQTLAGPFFNKSFNADAAHVQAAVQYIQRRLIRGRVGHKDKRPVNRF